MRININLNDKQQDTITELAKELGTTKSDVLRTALALLKVAVKENKSGNSLSVTKDGKVVKELVGIFNQ